MNPATWALKLLTTQRASALLLLKYSLLTIAQGKETKSRKVSPSHKTPLAWQSKELDTKIPVKASQVAQWLRVCLLMQGTRVRALAWEDPTCRGAAGPVSHNCWACASGACALQRERPRRWEARASRWRVAPACHNWRKPSHRSEDLTQPKKKKKIPVNIGHLQWKRELAGGKILKYASQKQTPKKISYHYLVFGWRENKNLSS